MTQNSFNAHDHLVTIRAKDGTMKPYLPAAWRLYQLNLLYPNANFSSEIIHLDVEHNLVVVKCRLYLGASYEQSDKKTEAMKSGPLSSLDKVETAAKARCARDFGISTELALDITEVEETEDAPIIASERSTARPQNGTSNNTPAAVQATPAPTDDAGLAHSAEDASELAAIKAELKLLGLASDAKSFQDWRLSVLHYQVRASALTSAELKLLREALEDHKLAGVADAV